MTQIILCATQRCGSTMVVEDMRNSGVLGKPGEYFIPWQPDKRSYTGKDFNDTLAQGNGDNGVTSVKVMPNQAARINAALSSTDTSGAEPLLSGFRSSFDDDAIWVHIKRLNVVAQAISRVVARQTGINHATKNANDKHFAGNLLKGYDKNYNAGLEYRPKAIAREVGAVAAGNRMWETFFEDHEIKPITLVYEDYAFDTSNPHIAAISSAAGIPKPETKPRSMVKLSNNLNTEWERRFMTESAFQNFSL